MLRISSIQTLISITAINKLEVYQINIKITFLNGELDVKVYMDQLEGLLSIDKKKTCKFVKSLYF